MAAQPIAINQPYSAALQFADGKTRIGTVTPSDPSVQIKMTPDGSACVIVATKPVALPITLIWHDPSGLVPDFTFQITTVASVAVPQPTTGSFSEFVTGTTPGA